MCRTVTVVLLGGCLASATEPPFLTFEELAFWYRTDKSRDDHKYSDVYGTLFTPIRLQVRNLTEVGVFNGASLQVWHDFFPNAHVFGIDLSLNAIHRESRKMLEGLARVSLLEGNCMAERALARFGIATGSQDVIIDDGDHSPQGQQLTLQHMWRLLRPGGLYIIEDVMTGAPAGMLPERVAAEWHGKSMLVHTPRNLTAHTRAVFAENDVFFVDPMVGHRALSALTRTHRTHRFIRDRINSNTHMLVLRKREAPRAPRIRCHTRRGTAMLKGIALRGMLALDDVAASRAAIQTYLRSAGSDRCTPPDWGCLARAAEQSTEPAEKCGGTCIDLSLQSDLVRGNAGAISLD